jgi:hypothetical protein
MKVSKALLATSLAAVMVSTMGSSVTMAEDSIAVIVKATTSEYWQWVFKGAQAAGKQLGVKVEELGTPKGRSDLGRHGLGHSGHHDRLGRQHHELRVVPHDEQPRGRQGRG